MKTKCLIAVFIMMFTPMKTSIAIEPSEIFKDPVLEQRARNLSQGLRCLVCQNQSIDDSNADLARDLRLVVRERLKLGYTNDQVLDFVVSRYGEFVLLRPRLNTRTALLWLSPVLILSFGIIGIIIWFRRRNLIEINNLSSKEEKKVLCLLSKNSNSKNGG
ncbi:MAG: cytochrome c-type biogenesis protein CcmH [Rhodospirillaceae bacterium]|jgi:cytochrome c-type biogenesis protein CcmH|nr:cytochrome c-type biogenesis protein CcmH [Rhodospirillaceae bacterium]